MSFCLLADESVENGIKRIVTEEINQAIKEIDNPRLKRSEAIHEVRKHCKKIRGVLRLVRPQFEQTYQFENVWFRDTAKGLAELRDAEAILETYDSLLDKFSDQIDRRAFAPMRRALTLRRKKIFEETGDLNEKLKKIRARMEKAAARAADWQLKVEEFDGIEGGLVATYRRARKTLTELSDLLGDDHNLDVLHKTLLHSPKKYGKKRDIQVLLGLIDRRSAELRVEANRIGARIFVEKPNT